MEPIFHFSFDISHWSLQNHKPSFPVYLDLLKMLQMANEKRQMLYGKSLFLLDAQLPSQPQLKPIHLTIIRGMIVAAEMNETMKNELSNFLIER